MTETEKKVLRITPCPHCNGKARKTRWIQIEKNIIPVEEKCPFCNNGVTYIEELYQP